MLLLQIVLVILTFSGKVFAPISPDEIDPSWLTLATVETSPQIANEQQRSGSQEQILQAIKSVPAIKNPILIPKKRRGQHFKTPEHIENIRAAWTPERRRKQAEITRTKQLERGDEFRAKIKASWTDERRKTQSEITRRLKTGFVHSKETREKMTKSRLGKKKSKSTREKIREAVKRSHALRKERKLNERRENDPQE